MQLIIWPRSQRKSVQCTHEENFEQNWRDLSEIDSRIVGSYLISIWLGLEHFNCNADHSSSASPSSLLPQAIYYCFRYCLIHYQCCPSIAYFHLNIREFYQIFIISRDLWWRLGQVCANSKSITGGFVTTDFILLISVELMWIRKVVINFTVHFWN